MIRGNLRMMHSLAVDIPLELRVAARRDGACLGKVPHIILFNICEQIAKVHVDLGGVEVAPAVFDATEPTCTHAATFITTDQGK